MKTPTHVKQPASPARIHPARSAFTLIELLVVITIIAILAGIALPVFGGVLKRAAQTNALSNAKQIGMAMRLYAGDNNGIFPSYTLQNGQPSTSTVSDSNTAFAQLFPNYLTSEKIFWLSKSAFCSSTPPDEIIDNPPLDTPVNTLKSGENEWAYVTGLNDSSNSSLPLIADGFAIASGHTYSKDQSQRGGVWQGTGAIVVHPDDSGSVMPVNANDLTIHSPNGGTTPGDIFTTTNAANGWLGVSNIVVNPK